MRALEVKLEIPYTVVTNRCHLIWSAETVNGEETNENIARWFQGLFTILLVATKRFLVLLGTTSSRELRFVAVFNILRTSSHRNVQRNQKTREQTPMLWSWGELCTPPSSIASVQRTFELFLSLLVMLSENERKQEDWSQRVWRKWRRCSSSPFVTVKG